MERSGAIRIGKVTKVHGLKGVVKVYPYGEDETALKAGLQVRTVHSGGVEKTVTVNWTNPGNRSVLVSFDGVDSREAAQALVGAELVVDRLSLPKLEDGNYYWFDLIGLDVYDCNAAYIGCVASIIPTGGNDVYVVRSGDRETLVPALDWVVRSIDLERRTMQVDLPEGL